MAKPSTDSYGCDWKEVERLWATLLPSDKEEVQRKINQMGLAAVPFHTRLENIIAEHRREKAWKK